MSAAPQTVRVIPDNFPRAETDLYFGNVVKDGGFGKFMHNRGMPDLDHQIVIRMNRDTLYSSAVFDLDAGPVTITLPDPGTRFMSMQIFDEDEYVPEVVYGAGTHTYTRENIGTRYMCAAIRTLVDPNDPADLKKVHALQDAITVEQKSAGHFEIPQWDGNSQTKVRDALLALGATMPDSHRAFGTKRETDPVRHLIGAAVGWGGNPEKDAYYEMGAVPQNDGKTVYRLTVKDVPVDGFWSVTVYNAKGYFEKNDRGAHSVNNITAKRDVDGSVTIQFGGDPAKAPNQLPIMPGWNYAVRMYRPREDILSGKWKFPDAQPVN